MIQIMFSIIVVCAHLVMSSCQPQTKRDRAGVGPATEAPITQPDNGGDVDPDTATGWTLNVENWEETLKSLCERKKSAACSQLAFEAQRRGLTQEAVSYFSQSCLGTAEPSDCSAQSSSNARSCFELSKIYESEGRLKEASSFKSCSCARKYKPAC
jgi:hypothetical protein